MSDYRRWYVPGGTYFFTVVTHDRAPTFRTPGAAPLLGAVMRTVRAKDPFRTLAIVLLWDHLHCVWALPEGDSGFSRRWRRIKGEFTERWLVDGGDEGLRSPSRLRQGERAVWQRRFWEHQIRDEPDLERHVDYIHYNPVKHGYVGKVADWPWSSFHRHVRRGQYPREWGSSEPAAPMTRPRE
jgi:putative transposase